MDWKLIAVINIVLCVTTAHPPRAAKSEQTFIKYFGKEEKINAESDKSERQEEYVESYPSYEFSYKVSDPHTHDFKGQQEKRHGDKVNGNYWLIQPDGRKRLVKYHANDHIGFNVLIDYSQKDNEKGDGVENKESSESNAKNENEKRTWHVIHDYKMKKASREGGSQEESNTSTDDWPSKENTESEQTEGQDIQNSRQNEAQESDRSRNSQEGKREKSKESTEINSNQRRKEGGGGGSRRKNENQSRQESSRGNSNEQQNSGQSVSSKENSKSEKSGEKIYWYRIPHKYLKKGYEVIDEIKEENREENKELNEGVGGRSTETANEQSAERSNRSNEEKNEASGEQNSAWRESSENGSKEKVYGYKSYVYHIRH